MSEILTRREANKARTREAVAGALRTLLEQRPVHEITVDQLSEAAGISRRTFFNYYAGIPAVLSEVFAEYAADLLTHIDRDQLAHGPVQAMRGIVRPAVLPREFLGWLAVLNCHDNQDEEAFELVERAVWADMGRWLQDVLRDLMPPDTDPLYIATLAPSVMHSFAAAEAEWVQGLARLGNVTDTDILTFCEHLDRALAYLQAGWQHTTS
ncbi:TetR/AcrR family transcriptional regulator [Ornithinimicrobium pratense]|uniref:TetR/AcrR family transcriptional regulator n=1 Tax=Ornithinimicrobium pratense TaxID=2593973 RepID=A0A5J6V8B2_9MICO|nr:TetR/AcrR family transcriptional regulator [Ornithinimicrobium pratense]QFG69391.1 TetR/AcrR family transcriptional regulator [Ornithinimicrobium pratense]